MAQFDVAISVVLYNTDKDVISDLVEKVFASSGDLKFKLCLVDNSPLASDYSDMLTKFDADYIKAPINGGYGYGHNIAINKYADNSKYHLVLNPDVILASDELNQIFHYMEANTNVGLSSPKICNLDGSPQYVARKLPEITDVILRFSSIFIPKLINIFSNKVNEHVLKEYADAYEPYYAPYISGCFMFMRSDVLKKVGGFDEKFFMYYEDVDLSRRMLEQADNVVIANVSVKHGWERGSHKKITLLKAHVKSVIYYFRKHGFVFDKSRCKLNIRVGVVK